MNAICTSCGKSFDTTLEDAYDPGRQCASCYRAERDYTPTLWNPLEYHRLANMTPEQRRKRLESLLYRIVGQEEWEQ